jgi:serine/threonine-protein kinase
MQLAPGDKFDRYTIAGLLGEGGMGRVYRARDAKLERDVAIKLLRADDLPAADAHAASLRLLHEARAAAALDHVNAVAIYDVGEANGVAFIAMELVEGASLRSYVGDASVPIGTRVRWLVEIAHALSAAHARGLVHRDIKPENVIVRSDGVVKVLDFGIARAQTSMTETMSGVDVSPFGPTSTRGTRSVIGGTPRYMAPEQLVGDTLDARVDQFAWGVVAYELLTGKAPWAGASGASLTLVSQIASDEPADAGPLGDACSPRVAKAVLRALSKNRDERFASMTDAVAALEERERSPRRRFAMGAVALAAITAVAIGAVEVSRVRAAKLAVPAATSMAAFVAPAPTRIIDVQVPASANDEAKAAFLSGLRLFREGSLAAAVQALVRSTDLDPTLAAAHLRIVIHGRYVPGVNAHTHFGKAQELRALLSARDQAALWAIEPEFLEGATGRTARKEVARRVREIATRWPLDAELQFWVATFEDDDATPEAYAAYERALAIDPEFAYAFTRLANVHLLVGDYTRALGALDRCLTAAPSSKGCLALRITSNEELGHCVEMERDARLLESVSGSARSSDFVARVLFANGAPMQAVRGALERKWMAAAPAERDSFKSRDEAHLAILAGDFVAAERTLRDALALVARSSSEDDHADATLPLVELLLEMGKDADAGRIADEYLKSRPSWKSAGAWSPVPQLFGIAVHAGLRSERDRGAALAEWLALWDEWGEGPTRQQSWLLGYAFPATTEAEAAVALARAPQPMPRVHSNQFHREGLEAKGRVLFLAGRIAEAVPFLRLATATCSALEVPVEHTHASLHLAQALEKSGDVAGACSGYATVVERWGSAKPRSVSADVARTRRRALGCP